MNHILIRTVSIKLATTPEQSTALQQVRFEYARVCNLAVEMAHSAKVFNKVELHHTAYYALREQSAIGSQLVCRAMAAVCDAYKVLGRTNKIVRFSPGSVHYDARTFRLLGDGTISLYTMAGRIKVPLVLGEHQRRHLAAGVPREGKLIFRDGTWFFNLAIRLPDAQPASGDVMGVDVGEVNIAATSTSKIFSGKQLCFERDKRLALRSRLQANGTQSSQQLLRKVSGREQRRVRHVNHVTSKALVAEAVKHGAGTIAMEDLTHIRARIKAGKRVRARLHRWSWRQLQDFVAYKAEQAGLAVVYVEPAYTSQTCAMCSCLGKRRGSLFRCSCGNRRHADANAASNIRRLPELISSGTGCVTTRHVA